MSAIVRTPVAEVDALVDAAISRYEFRRRWHYNCALVRRSKADGKFEMLVDGCWVRVGRPPLYDDVGAWEKLSPAALRAHVVKFLVTGLGAERIRWAPSVLSRLRRSALGRRLVPPMAGGAARFPLADYERKELIHDGFEPTRSERELSRDFYIEELAGTCGAALTELRDQAQSGYDLWRERGAAIEQRANFFLGAAGLSTTLVLTNASLLLGNDGLDSPWRELSAGTLAVASVFAILAGVRAMQAITFTFFRTSPNRPGDIFERRAVSGVNKPVRAYLGALLVAQEREALIVNWKTARLGAARLWFTLAVAGVAVVTTFVLIQVL
ncbi:MAG TPA: hypothetical protein VFJ57_07395 [Solirubrobacterales bacterium]|nr:hypothetical protein [Solirubrobacterales bacterium]